MIRMIVAGVLLAQVTSGVTEAPVADPADTPERAAVTLSCIVNDAGRPEDCEIVSEDPPGYGFGEEAIKSMRTARFRRRDRSDDRNGRAVFTVHFTLEGAGRRIPPRDRLRPNHAVPFPDRSAHDPREAGEKNVAS